MKNVDIIDACVMGLLNAVDRKRRDEQRSEASRVLTDTNMSVSRGVFRNHVNTGASSVAVCGALAQQRLDAPLTAVDCRACRRIASEAHLL